MNGPSSHSGRHPGPIPPRWLKCPRKSTELIGGKFLALKTPLDTRFDAQVPTEYRFPPSMIFNSMKGYKVKVGLWIDLCNTSRFYSKREVEAQECRYVKLQCRGHGETPSEEQVTAFVTLCRKFAQQNPLEVIAVHCTHGFNRTGFLICSYLIETEDWSPEASTVAFANSRPPGIYKADYLEELFRRYGDASDAPAVPDLPDWCFEEQDNVDDDGNPVEATTTQEEESPRRESSRNSAKVPVFMAGVPGVAPVTTQPLLTRIQKRFQYMCHWKKNGFPGAQPVSMDRDNMQNVHHHPYKVSWKADGTRYMMLIDGKNAVYFADRDHCIFKVEGLTFLHRKDENKYIAETLLDGEMVIDEVGNERFPRYLVYDIIRFEGLEVGKTEFERRMLCVAKEIVGARSMYIQKGKIDKTQEPFSVRQKQFWDLSEARVLLGPKFTKESLGHEPDGLIFQPAKEPYLPGRDDKILKWKPSSHNSIDFKLQIVREDRPGMVAKSVGHLYVGSLPTPFAEIKLNSVLRELNHKIIECKWDANKWVFMRERTDKSFPNAYNTAMGVMKSIAAPVTEDMLLKYIDSHGWGRKLDEFMPPPSKVPKIVK